MSWIDRLPPTDRAAMLDAGRIGPERRPGGIRTIYRAPDEEVIGQWPDSFLEKSAIEQWNEDGNR